MNVKPTYEELENRIKELESIQNKPDTVDFESLNAFEKQNRIWIQNSPVCTKIVDLDFNLQFMSEAGVKGLQIENIKEHYGKPYPLNFFPDSFKIPMAKNLKKVKELGVITRDAEILDINGQKIWFHSSIVPVFDEKGAPDYYLVISVDITEQKKIEEKLKKSQERLSQVLDNSGDWVWEVDTNGLYTYVSDAIEDALGFKAVEIINKKHFYDFFHESNNEDLKKLNFERMKAQKLFRDAENLNVAKNGDLVWISTSGSPLFDENGTLIGYRGADSNITKRKEEAQVLKDSDERWKTLFRDIPSVAVQGYDKNGKTIYWNKASETFYGYTSEEAIGSKLTDLIIPEEAKSYVSDAIQEMFTSKIAIPSSELKLKRKDGSLISVFSSHSYVEIPGGGAEMYCLDIDLSENKQVEEALEESEKKYSTLANNAVDFIWEVDLELNTKYVSPSGYKITGYTVDEMLKMNAKELFPEDRLDEITNMIAKEVALGKLHVGKAFESEYLSKNRKRIPVEISAKIIRDKDFKPIGISGRTSDISKRKEEELELLKAKEKAEESDLLKTEFINNMSHEIRTPMNGIMGFSGLLDNNDMSDEKRASFIKIIQNSSQQLLNVIDDILDISRLGTKQVKVIESEVCLNDVMFELFSTFDIKAKEHKYPLYLKKGLSDEKSTIITDKTKLNKILSNFLENALKFTNDGFIEFGYQLKNENIEFYVKDTGIGIEACKQESIFERFSQAEKDLSKNVGGLGLGLSIAKENAALLGGSIHLESEKGKGATFFLTIPYKSVYEVNDSGKSKYAILIAEDEEINQLYLEALLKDILDLDCEIIHVINGKEAIEACKENQSIDLVLMDLKMPILNGFEATKLIKKLYPNLPIIAQTAYSRPQDKEQAILAGCDDFISKPIQQKSFKKILEKYLIM